MKILLLTHSFNCLTQRFQLELRRLGHQVTVEFDVNDAMSIDAVERFEPDLIVAPFLKRAIPEAIWRNYLCLIVHPGIKGDRGPSSIDWAILNGETEWGVTLLQANEVMDGGDIWASQRFSMRPASKSSLYRGEVTEAAWRAMEQVLEQLPQPDFAPEPLDYNRDDVTGQWRCLMTQADRAIDWTRDDAATIVTKIRSADGNPGLLSRVAGRECYLFNACADFSLNYLIDGVSPGTPVAQRDGAIALASCDTVVWVSHLRLKPTETQPRTLKLPATRVLDTESLSGLPELSVGLAVAEGYQPIRARIDGKRAYLYFDFYNGAMGTDDCQQLCRAYRQLAGDPEIEMIVLMGGEDFWSNGIHLNLIEAADSPADESWANINAIDDLTQAIIETTDKLTVAVMRGNAGAGGVFMALAADRVLARDGVILNPHYKGMGNLYGSEYWTYLLPRRVGTERAEQITGLRLPMGVAEAKQLGLIDQILSAEQFETALEQQLLTLEQQSTRLLEQKRLQRQADEHEKPLAEYRAEELERMKLNFYGFDPSYHVARYHFVYKLPKARTPPYLAPHRRVRQQA
ncbi:hydrogenase maturation protein [Motiliproteus sp.]|uniref:hydrogenase maturation protein n=1 Tax=Motiliproteus sp. TaxID=1898955 RepID=UPI003BA8706F